MASVPKTGVPRVWRDAPIAIFALGAAEAALARHLLRAFPLGRLSVHKNAAISTENQFDRIASAIEEQFDTVRGMLVLAPLGVVVRSLAPLVQNKHTDPAVVVVDAGARHAISVLGGHEGGANALCLEVANALDADPIITTTSETLKRLIVGVGCRRGTASADIVSSVKQGLEQIRGALSQVRVLGSVDRKRDEAGLLSAARELGVPLQFAAKETLQRWSGPKNPRVMRSLGVPAVSEPCALLLGRRTRLVLPKTVFCPGVTVAIAEETWPWTESTPTAAGLAPPAPPAKRR